MEDALGPDDGARTAASDFYHSFVILSSYIIYRISYFDDFMHGFEIPYLY